MSQTTFLCPSCKQIHPVSVKELGKALYCQQSKAPVHLTRLDSYVLLDVLGAGAVGIVYRAYDLQNQREVALKQLNEKAVPADQFDAWVKRAVKEARALAKIEYHPNVLPLYTSGHVARRFYMVTPIIRGRTLDKMIPDGGFPHPPRAVQLAITILRALEHVHSFKVYHRDVKPSNVMIDGNGNLFLLDFGLASSRSAETAFHTEMGTILGTPAYMPPEQARGEINRVGPWSDQYGAGAVLFKMLTGGVPYPGKFLAAVLADVADYNKPPQTLRHWRPGLDPALEVVVMKSLAKYPGDRFSSCAEFADRLQAWCDMQSGSRPLEPEPAPPSERLSDPAPSSGRLGDPARLPQPTAPPGEAPQTRWVLWTALAVVAAVLAAWAGYLIWQNATPAQQAAPPIRFFDPTKKPADR